MIFQSLTCGCIASPDLWRSGEAERPWAMGEAPLGRRVDLFQRSALTSRTNTNLARRIVSYHIMVMISHL